MEENKVKKELKILIQKLDAQEIEKYTRKTVNKNVANKRSKINIKIKQEFSGVGSCNFAINGFIQTKCDAVSHKYSLRRRNDSRNEAGKEGTEGNGGQSVTEDTNSDPLMTSSCGSLSVRLPQPVVYINPNLNKIKIENDYVPVPEIKTEPQDSSQKLDPDPEAEPDENLVNPKFYINPNIFEDDLMKKEQNSQSFVLTFDKETQTTPEENASTETVCPENPEKKVRLADVEKILNKSLKKKRGIHLTYLQLKCLIKSIEKKDKKISRMKKQTQKNDDTLSQNSISKLIGSNVNAAQICSIPSHLEFEQKFYTEKDRLEKQNLELEDRITMYAKKVVTLFREKGIIQSSLEGKIQELNSQLSVQQSLIEELKRSEIQSVLQEKINGLNAQINWQQTLIGQFNQNEIQSTLQNEIGRLTIAQAQKSDQILILNDKLNIQQSEIRQLNAKIVMDAEKQKQLTCKIEEQQNLIDEMGEPKFKIPDLPIHILRKIFDILDISSLKTSRLVCRHWSGEGAKILHQKTYLTPCFPLHDVSKRFLLSARYLFAKDDLSSVHLLEKYPKLTLSVRHLKYEAEEENQEPLYKILQLLPNLETLQTNLLTFSPHQKWLEEKVETFNRIYSKLELFLMSLENLDELKLEFALEPHILRYHQRLECIQEIHVIGISVLNEFLKVNAQWGITKLILDVNAHSNTEIIREFLRRISKSLQHYRINITREFMNEACGQTSLFFLPWVDDWIIPVYLNELKTLEICSNSLLESSSSSESTKSPLLPPPPEFYIRLDEYLTKILLSSILLPRLEKIAIGCIPREFEAVCRKWNNNSLANGRRMQSHSMKEIKLLFVFPPTLSFPTIPTFIWPKLKCVKFSRRTINGFIVEEQKTFNAFV